MGRTDDRTGHHLRGDSVWRIAQERLIVRLLQLSKESARTIALLGVLLTVFGILISAMIWGIDDRTGQIMMGVMSALGLAITNLISALKSTETADRTAKVQNEQHKLRAAVSNGGIAPHAYFCPECPYREQQ